ncbi:unnamed protein product [Caenorhabditis bovis]|uniref:Uncharacterized protein n=1 Tax=Caenorhabditis bovis TaxID=2654633 RepID=A0A8S1F1T6_9PELO|nr:unnamed protein product [Caenorhabditis bovis]
MAVILHDAVANTLMNDDVPSIFTVSSLKKLLTAKVDNFAAARAIGGVLALDEILKLIQMVPRNEILPGKTFGNFYANVSQLFNKVL